MASKPKLTVEEVQEFIRDRSENNLLLDGQEFTPTVITLAMELAISAYNTMPPFSSVNIETFPSKSILLSGTLWKMYAGQATLLARNTMAYSDGGLQIPIEERYELYKSIAADFQAEFFKEARDLKTHLNIESGWGDVPSDYSRFPDW